jgi:hypothetical protein
VPKNFGRAGTKLEGCSPEQPNLFSVVREHDPPVKAKNGSDWRIANGEQRVVLCGSAPALPKILA